MHTYTITFINGSQQEITFANQAVNGDWIAFSDGSGLILQVRAAEVQRVERTPKKAGQSH